MGNFAAARLSETLSIIRLCLCLTGTSVPHSHNICYIEAEHSSLPFLLFSHHSGRLQHCLTCTENTRRTGRAQNWVLHGATGVTLLALGYTWQFISPLIYLCIWFFSSLFFFLLLLYNMTKDMVIWLISLVMAQILRRKQPLSKILFFIFQKDYRLMQRNIFIYKYMIQLCQAVHEWYFYTT